MCWICVKFNVTLIQHTFNTQFKTYVTSQLWVCKKTFCVWVREYGKRIFFSFHKNQKLKKKVKHEWNAS